MKRYGSLLFYLLIAGIFQGCNYTSDPASIKVRTGAEQLLRDHVGELEGLKVGVVMNQASVVDNIHMVDTLLSRGVNVTTLFAPEHGFRGEAGAGEKIQDGKDPKTGLPVYSLYGSVRKPSPEMLENIDVLLFDLQGMGLRFYTYISTLRLVIEAAAENDKQLWILDRPNPLGGDYVAGWVLREEYRSFVGAYPVPAAHGLTIGELARMAKGEKWLNLDELYSFRVIEMEGWKRNMRWPDTGLQWVAPSPNLPTFEHAYYYAGTVLFEGTNVSEGRGTPNPFLWIGSPGFNAGDSILTVMENRHSVQLDTLSFVPRSIPGKALHPKHQDEICYGISISAGDSYEDSDPIRLGLDLLHVFMREDPHMELNSFLDKLSGIDLKSRLESGAELPDWEQEVKEFKQLRAPYLIY